MLGAEGVVTLILDRLKRDMPIAVATVALKVGAVEGEIPLPKSYHPSEVPNEDISIDGFPFVTVVAIDTDGELTSKILDDDYTTTEYSLGYHVGITVYTQVAEGGELAARLQAYRLNLAIRQALLHNLTLGGDQDEVEDYAEIQFSRWAEDFATVEDETAGAWLGRSALTVPVVSMEYLDKRPYNNPAAVLVGFEVSATNPVTGEVIEETVDDPIDGTPYPMPEGWEH